LNFALNLEYLEANFYSFAVHGYPVPGTLMSGTGTQGGISGGRQVPFKSTGIQQLAQEIAGHELAHVTFLRSALGSAAVSQPAIDLKKSFTAAAQAAGVVPAGTAFDPFASEEFFLLGAFICRTSAASGAVRQRPPPDAGISGDPAPAGPGDDSRPRVPDAGRDAIRTASLPSRSTAS
jgi:hypothetical protein